MNLCSARNAVRYQYRLQGDDCMNECVMPALMYGCGFALSLVCPCGLFCIAPPFVAMSMQLLGETDQKKSGENGQYLTGYTPSDDAPSNQLAHQTGQAQYAQPGQVQYAQPGQAQYAQPGQVQYAQPGQVQYAQPGVYSAQPVQGQVVQAQVMGLPVQGHVVQGQASGPPEYSATPVEYTKPSAPMEYEQPSSTQQYYEVDNPSDQHGKSSI